MIKEILQKTLIQPKRRYTYFKIWSWIYAQSNMSNVYYGNVKEICLNCEVEYGDVNRAFELQSQWNNKEHEKTIVLRKEENTFTAQHNFYQTDKYFKLFDINLHSFPSAYKPIIVIFNSLAYCTMAETNPEANSLQTKLNLDGQNNETLKQPKKQHSAPKTEKKKEEKSQQELERQIEKQIEKKLLNECIDIYKAFCKEKLDIDNPPNLRFDKEDKRARGEVGGEINALKTIINYLRTNNKPTERTYEGIVNGFDMILRNWDKYSKYYQNQFKLRQISSNLINLIAEIKMRPKEMDTSKSAKALNFAKQMDEFVKAGGLKEQLENLGKSKY